MWRQMLAGDYLQIDETPVRVLDPDVAYVKKTGTGYVIPEFNTSEIVRGNSPIT